MQHNVIIKSAMREGTLRRWLRQRQPYLPDVPEELGKAIGSALYRVRARLGADSFKNTPSYKIKKMLDLHKLPNVGLAPYEINHILGRRISLLKKRGM